jgi:hypothetical protein
MARAAIPSGDVGALARVVRRTALLRLGLGLLLAGAVAATLWVAGGREVRETGFLPGGTSGVVVLDASKSVESAANRKTLALLRRIVELDQPVGLVVFSDIAYELLPPGSPARSFAPLERFFTPRPGGSGSGSGETVESPWTNAFSGGTQISTGLDAALEALGRDGVERPSILLVSDLDTASADRPRLTDALVRMRADGVRLRVVSLAPLPSYEEQFTRIFGDEAIVRPSELTGVGGERSARRLDGAPSLLLVGCALLVLLVAAAHERLLVRVPVPAPGGDR